MEERQDVTVLYNKMTIAELQNTFSFNVSVTYVPACSDKITVFRGNLKK